jgi:predicted dehydrogenase
MTSTENAIESNAPLRIVLVGCGGMSNAWINAIKPLTDASIVGLVDLFEDAAHKRRAEHGLHEARTYTSLDTALTELKPDVVFDVTIPEAHSENAIVAFRHGCHVLSEKPMAHSLEAAQRALEAANVAGRQYAVMQNRRYLRHARQVKHLLNDTRLGSLTTVHVDFFIGAHFGGFRDRMKHVLLLDMAIHTFDALRYLSGADALSVYCKEWNPAGSWYDHDASAVAIFEMSNGLVATYRGSWCAEGVNTSWESDWRFIGTHGSVRWDGGEGHTVEVVKAGVEAGFRLPYDALTLPDLDTNAVEHGHASCIQEFLRCVRTGERPLTHAADNIKSLAMVFGAIESAESGRTMPIAQR